ncbi:MULTISPECIES: GntR family transcriptional regulator [unclassified Streptomyces]|uniref:GntR family transcriptional regulator n=1 Tax=unclassified Streptomyces TaxID=2593676 RepID=UPI0033F0BBAF
MPGTDGPAVIRSTLRQQIADALRDEVLGGRLEPGQEFTVKEIAEQYGVSATPVREALVNLTAQGLLDADQHRGFRVHEHTLAEYRAMLEARGLVADGIFRDLAEHGARRDVADALIAVRRRGEEAARAACAGDLTVLIGYDLRFWRELSALFGNPHLSDFLHRLRVKSWVCAVTHLRRWCESSGEDLRGVLWSRHTELVDALARREPCAAHEIVVEYNAHSLALIERLAAA